MKTDTDGTMSYRESVRKSRLTLGVEGSSLTLSGRQLTGYGPRLGFDYGLAPSWSVGASLSQAFGGDGGGSSSVYSGFAAEMKYAVTGSFWSRDAELSHGGRRVYGSQSAAPSVWFVGAGAQQMFLNGTQFVFPAPGIGLSAGYMSTFWSTPLSLSLKSAQLTYQSETLSALFLNIDWTFSF